MSNRHGRGTPPSPPHGEGEEAPRGIYSLRVRYPYVGLRAHAAPSSSMIEAETLSLILRGACSTLTLDFAEGMCYITRCFVYPVSTLTWGNIEALRKRRAYNARR